MEEYNPNKKITLGEGQGLDWYHFSELSDLRIVDHDRGVLEYIKNKY